MLGSISSVFFFNDTATTEIYTLSLHDALPISVCCSCDWAMCVPAAPARSWSLSWAWSRSCGIGFRRLSISKPCREASLSRGRSEEHTSELQSQSNLVCRLLLEKKKTLTKSCAY